MQRGILRCFTTTEKSCNPYKTIVSVILLPINEQIPKRTDYIKTLDFVSLMLCSAILCNVIFLRGKRRSLGSSSIVGRTERSSVSRGFSVVGIFLAVYSGFAARL